MPSVDELIDVAKKLIKAETVWKDAKSSRLVDKALAKKILRRTSLDNAFHFLLDEDQPLFISSDSLFDFLKQIQLIDLKAIEYHFNRGDFESWICYLGDSELADRLKLVRQTGLSGEFLRRMLHEVIRSRYDELVIAMQ